MAYSACDEHCRVLMDAAPGEAHKFLFPESRPRVIFGGDKVGARVGSCDIFDMKTPWLRRDTLRSTGCGLVRGHS